MKIKDLIVGHEYAYFNWPRAGYKGQATRVVVVGFKDVPTAETRYLKSPKLINHVVLKHFKSVSNPDYTFSCAPGHLMHDWATEEAIRADREKVHSEQLARQAADDQRRTEQRQLANAERDEIVATLRELTGQVINDHMPLGEAREAKRLVLAAIRLCHPEA